MRTATRTKLPTEPIDAALVSAREVAQTVRTKGTELLDSDALHELLHKGQHVAVVARDRGTDLLESEKAHEIRRRGRNVVLAAKGDVGAVPKRTRKGVGMLLFAAGAAAGLAAAVVSRRMATDVPPAIDTSYDDPAAQFPKKDGVIDLTSVAVAEGVTDTPVQDMTALSDIEVGTTTGSTKAAATNGSKARASNGRATGTSTAQGTDKS